MNQPRDSHVDLPPNKTKTNSREASNSGPTTTNPNHKIHVGNAGPEPSDVPEKIERYHIEGEIARGGMGVVVRAYDPDFERKLALKILLPSNSEDDSREERFLEEAKITGQLEHPGIPPVHELGLLEDGRPFFAMKLIEGETLDGLLKRRKDPSEDRMRFVNVFEQICLALAYAHDRNVIHRDLKPANVMVGRFGEVQLMDWGLSKQLKQPQTEEVSSRNDSAKEAKGPPTESKPEDATLSVCNLSEAKTKTLVPDHSQEDTRTRVGSIMGTPSYMAPEQALGEVDQVDTRSDVFGLGAILCVVLTGEPPYVRGPEGTTLTEAAKASLQGAWRRLTECGADKELIELAKRCLSPVKNQRPKDAGAVAEAIRDYRSKFQDRLKKAEVDRAQAEVKAAESRKRHWITVALMTSLLVLVGVLGGVGYWRQSTHAAEQRRLAEKQRIEAEQREKQSRRAEANRQALQTELAGVYRLADKHLWDEARQQLEQARKRISENTPELQNRWKKTSTELRFAEELGRIREPEEYEAGKQLKPPRETAKLYAKVFLAPGRIGPEGADPKRVAERVRASSIRQHLIPALDEWASMTPSRERRKWLHQIANLSDPGKWKNKLRQDSVWNDKEALEELARQVDPSKQPPQFLDLLAKRLYATGGDALSFLRRAHPHHPTHFGINLRLGSLLHWDRKDEEALQYFRVALVARPKSPDVCYFLGASLHNLTRYEEARAYYYKALAQQPQEPAYHSSLGLTLRRMGEQKEALERFHKAIKLDESYFPPYVHIGVAYSQQNDYREAIQWFQKALERNPKHAESWYNLGYAYSQTGDREKGVDCYKKATEANPEYADPYNGIGEYLQAEKKYHAAIFYYQKAINRKRDHFQALTNVGTAYGLVGEYRKAVEAHGKAIALRPTLPLGYYNLGVAHLRFGRHEEAIRAFRKVTTLDQQDAEGFQNLGAALFRKGELRQAIEAFERLDQLRPKSSDGPRLLGLVYMKKGDYRLAVDAFERATKRTNDERTKNQMQSLAEQANQYTQYQQLLQKHKTGTQWRLAPDKALGVATFCLEHQNRYATAAELFQHAFAKRPKAATTIKPAHRYNAACAAVLACAGKGKDFSRIKEKERASLRKRALGWLRDDVKDCFAGLAANDMAKRKIAKERLEHSLQDADLTTVREPEYLATYEEDERKEWQALWSQVRGKLKELK